MSRLDQTIQAKLQKRSELEKAGVVVHPHHFDKRHTVAQALQSMDQTVQTAGRIRSLRTHGKVTFIDIEDHTANSMFTFLTCYICLNTSIKNPICSSGVLPMSSKP